MPADGRVSAARAGELGGGNGADETRDPGDGAPMSGPGLRWRRRPEGSTWGDYGPDDELGRLNLLTPEKVR